MWFNKNKNKKIYKIEWSFGSGCQMIYTDLVKANDVVEAWNKITKNHAFSIYCVSIEEIERGDKDNGF